MKKIFISLGSNYKFACQIKRKLELMGYIVILDSFNTNLKKDEKNKESFLNLNSKNKIKDTDLTLVLNLTKERNGYIYKNYIDETMRLQMHYSILLNHNIYLYNESVNNEFENIKSLDGNLFKLESGYNKFKNNKLLNYFTLNELESLYNSFDSYTKAIVIAKRVFKDNLNNFKVLNKLDGYIDRIVYLLKLLVENSEITFKDLLEIGFLVQMVESSSIVLNDKTNQIIDSNNECAMNIKIACLSYEMDKMPDENKGNYNKQLIKLKNVMKGRYYDRY